MSPGIHDMYDGLQPRRVATLLIAIIWTVSAAYGQSRSSTTGSTSTSDFMLPRNVVVPLSVVKSSFSEMAQETSTGQDLTAVGNPKATRSVIYTSSDDSKKMTITVDQYANSSDASSAYQEAILKSKTVPGFKRISTPDLGRHAFIGTVTQGAETHIGVGARDGTLIVGATLVGYDPTPANTAKLIALTHEEEENANAVLSSDVHLEFFSSAYLRLLPEFHYPIFFYERSGSDFARIFCALARHLVRQPRYGSGARRSGFEDL